MSEPTIQALKDYEATMVVLRQYDRTKIAFESLSAAIEWSKENHEGIIDAIVYVDDERNSTFRWADIKPMAVGQA